MQTPKLPNKKIKKACILKPAPGILWKQHPIGPWGRPKVIVDWHNTLELNDQVPPTQDKALDALLEKADVYMLSFCGKDRKPQALTNMVKMSIWTPSTYFEEENTSGRIGRAVFQVIPPQLGWCSGGEQSRARYRRSQEQGSPKTDDCDGHFTIRG